MTENKESSSSSSWLPWRRSTNKNTDNKNIDENQKKIEATTTETAAATTATTEATSNKNIENEQNKSKNKEEKTKNQDKQKPRTKEEEERKNLKRLEKKNRFLLQEEMNKQLLEKKNRMVDLLLNPPILTANLSKEDKSKILYNRYGYPCTPKVMLWKAGFFGGIAGALIGNSIAKTNPIKPLKTFFICLFAGTGGYITSSYVYKDPLFRENYEHYNSHEYEMDVEQYFLNEVPIFLVRRELLKKNIKTDIHGHLIEN
ncbi:hypothetical protein ACTFIV_001543 [Dictyostelium citrinum]